MAAWTRVWLMLLAPIAATAQTADLWINPMPGHHAVGFQSSFAIDTSRQYEGRKGRPILLDVWYPAANAAGEAMLYEKYFHVPDAPGYPKLPSRLEQFVRGVAIDDLGKSPQAFAKLLTIPTGAHADAPYAEGRFPVVIYHSGAAGSFEENSLLFEMLASNGYIVVSSAYESPLRMTVGNNYGTDESSPEDLGFIAALAQTWPHADASKLAVMGHSMGAQYEMIWIGSARCPAKAFVSLDTTLEYTAENFRGHRGVRRELKRQTPPHIPVLLFVSGARHPNFHTWDAYLQHSARYEASVAELHHDDYLTHGFLGAEFTGKPNAAAIRRSYEEVCRTILLFLNASLQGDEAAAGALKKPVEGSPVSVKYVPSQ